MIPSITKSSINSFNTRCSEDLLIASIVVTIFATFGFFVSIGQVGIESAVTLSFAGVAALGALGIALSFMLSSISRESHRGRLVQAIRVFIPLVFLIIATISLVAFLRTEGLLQEKWKWTLIGGSVSLYLSIVLPRLIREAEKRSIKKGKAPSSARKASGVVSVPKMRESRPSCMTLPAVLQSQIASFLTVDSVAKMIRTCKEGKAVFTSDRVWRGQLRHLECGTQRILTFSLLRLEESLSYYQTVSSNLTPRRNFEIGDEATILAHISNDIISIKEKKAHFYQAIKELYLKSNLYFILSNIEFEDDPDRSIYAREFRKLIQEHRISDELASLLFSSALEKRNYEMVAYLLFHRPNLPEWREELIQFPFQRDTSYLRGSVLSIFIIINYPEGIDSIEGAGFYLPLEFAIRKKADAKLVNKLLEKCTGDSFDWHKKEALRIAKETNSPHLHLIQPIKMRDLTGCSIM